MLRTGIGGSGKELVYLASRTVPVYRPTNEVAVMGSVGHFEALLFLVPMTMTRCE